MSSGVEESTYIVRLKSGETNPRPCLGMAAAQRWCDQIGKEFVECLLRWDGARWVRV